MSKIQHSLKVRIKNCAFTLSFPQEQFSGVSFRAWKSSSRITVFDGEFWEITMETHATFAAIHISNLFQNDVKNILKHKLIDQIMFKS